MKKIYGDHLEDIHKSKNLDSRWSDKDKEEFKSYVTNKIKNDNIMESVLNLIVFVGISIIIGLAIYFAWN